MDRGKQGRKRSTVTEATGIPLPLVAAGANRPDSPLRTETLLGLTALGPLPAGSTVQLDRGYDSEGTRRRLAALGFTGAIARKGLPARSRPHVRWTGEAHRPKSSSRERETRVQRR